MADYSADFDGRGKICLKWVSGSQKSVRPKGLGLRKLAK